MAHAYTPGLKVSTRQLIQKVRRLPIKGDVLVKEGQVVEPDTPVARTELPGDPETVNVANWLSIDAEDLPLFMRKKAGDKVEKGETLAQTSGFFGWFRRGLESPLTGTVEMVSKITGQVTIRNPPIPVEVHAYMKGKVKEVLPGEGVIVESRGSLIQGIFGVGGERHGAVRCLVSGPDQILDPADVGHDCQGTVIVAGRLITGPVLKRAAEVGVAGIIAGGIVDSTLIEFLGHDIGVAITGQEDIPLTLVLTEGFGEMRMADRTFDLLKQLDGQVASINGATQIRAGVMRPEIIVTTDAMGADDGVSSESAGLGQNTPIRIIRPPWFGQLAEVVSLPPELTLIESGARVRVLTARLTSGEVVTIPRANVEIIES